MIICDMPVIVVHKKQTGNSIVIKHVHATHKCTVQLTLMLIVALYRMKCLGCSLWQKSLFFYKHFQQCIVCGIYRKVKYLAAHDIFQSRYFFRAQGTFPELKVLSQSFRYFPRDQDTFQELQRLCQSSRDFHRAQDTFLQLNYGTYPELKVLSYTQGVFFESLLKVLSLGSRYFL